MTVRVYILKKRIPVKADRAARIARSVLRREGISAGGIINICFVSDPMIRALNRRFHGRDRTTDVLAFDLGAGSGKGGADVYISVDTAVTNARSFKTTPAEEALLYVIHAMLHLAGYGDRTAKQRALMRQKEQLYLNPITRKNR